MASQFYEAVYLLRQVLQKLPQTLDKETTRQFISSKITYYDTKAKALLSAATSNSVNNPSKPQQVHDPRSPVYDNSNGSFFNDSDGTAVAVAVPIPDSTTANKPPAASKPAAANTAASLLAARSHEITQQAGQANARLARALDLDERQEVKAAIEEYMSAAEMYLRCIRLVDDEEDRQEQQHFSQTSSITSIKPILKRRLKAALGKFVRRIILACAFFILIHFFIALLRSGRGT